MSKVNKQKFTKLHKFLFEDTTFNGLPTKGKLLYAILTERQNLSKRNVKKDGIQSQYIDDNGRLFSIYSNAELVNKLNMSEPTVIKLKKQLIGFNLLEEIRVPNSNNKLYPKKPYDEYFYINDIDEFYRLPHALFENSFYRSLSPETIVAYAIYLSRYEYSVYKNHFCDKNNDVFCYFSNEKMANILNVSLSKVERIKKELIASGLMVNKRSKFGTANKLYINLPKRWYNKELKICRHRNLKSAGSGTKNLRGMELKICSTSYTYFNYTYSSDIDSSDMNYMDDITLKEENTERTNHSNNTSHITTENYSNNTYKTDTDLDQIEKDILLQKLPKSIQISFKSFSNSEIRCIKNVLNKAKANYNHNAPIDERVTYEECDYEIAAAIKRIKYFSVQRKEAISALEGYMMQTFKKVFREYIQSQIDIYNTPDTSINRGIEHFEPKNDMQELAKQMFLPSRN